MATIKQHKSSFNNSTYHSFGAGTMTSTILDQLRQMEVKLATLETKLKASEEKIEDQKTKGKATLILVKFIDFSDQMSNTKDIQFTMT